MVKLYDPLLTIHFLHPHAHAGLLSLLSLHFCAGNENFIYVFHSQNAVHCTCSPLILKWPDALVFCIAHTGFQSKNKEWKKNEELR